MSPTDGPVIIEVAVNGVTTKDRNPRTPEAPDEVAADALLCLDAGASVVHVHCRPGGLPTAEAARAYAAALEPVAKARPDAILYPTMGSGATISERYDHHIPLAEAGTIRMGVLDPGSVNLAATANDGTPPETGYAYVNTPADIHHMMGVCRDQGLGPSFAIYEPGFLRTVLAYHHAGVLPAGSLTKFYFSGSGYFGGGLPLYSGAAHPRSPGSLPGHARRHRPALGCHHARRFAARYTGRPDGDRTRRPSAGRPRGLQLGTEQRRAGRTSRRLVS